VSIGPGRALRAAEGLCEELAPIALIVPAQLVAERLAVLRGRDPDRPPGLTKVTRTH
jgi:glucosamine--fructose-6-phosphate aminotransferase (isomerizing)